MRVLKLLSKKSVLVVLSISLLFAFNGFTPRVGAQSPGSPVYSITNCDELQAMESDLEGSYTLANDIDCSETNNEESDFSPIGGTGFFESAFTGTFDGQDHTITNLYSSNGETSPAGLFGMITGSASIKNLTLADCQIFGGPYTGAVAGIAFGAVTISNVTTNCLVVGNNTVVSQADPVVGVGGLVGVLAGYEGNLATINRSHTQGVVVAIYSGAGERNRAGGLVGYMFEGSKLTNSYSSATVVGDNEGDILLGGAVGGSMPISEGTKPVINNVYSIGEIFGSDANRAGGLIGIVGGSDVQNTFTASRINGSASKGGLIGTAAWDGSGMIWNNNYVDITSVGALKCVGNFFLPQANCTQVNTENNPDTSYFIGNKVNEPMHSWDFDTIWQIQENDYPTLAYRPVTPPVENNPEESNSGNSNGGTKIEPKAGLKKAKQIITSSSLAIPSSSEPAGIFLNDYDEYTNGSGHTLSGLTVGRVIHFDITVKGEIEHHTMTIKEIGDGYITVSIASTPFDVRLSLNKLTNITIEGQAVMTAQLVSINGTTIDLKLAEILTPVKVASPELAQPINAQSTPGSSYSGPVLALFSLLLLIVAAVAVYFRKRKNA